MTGVVAWAAFSVIIISAFRIAGLIDGYPILPRLALLGLPAAAVLGGPGPHRPLPACGGGQRPRPLDPPLRAIVV